MSHHYMKFENVSYSYPDGSEALHDVSFSITHGTKLALLGLNGAGKSTLLLHMNGLLIASSGKVIVGGVEVSSKTAKIVRQHVGMVFQNSDNQLFMPTIDDDVAFGPLNMQLPEQEVSRRVECALSAVGMLQHRHRPSFKLSGGQKRSCAIATVLSMEPDVLVLDEPTAGLDCRQRRQIIEIIRAFPHTCVIATHDVDLAQQICERAVLLDSGRVVADGNTADMVKEMCEL